MNTIIEDEFPLPCEPKPRNGLAIIKDLCELRDKLKALLDETFEKYMDEDAMGIPAGQALYAVDSTITEAIGEILHAEYEAKRLTFTGENGEPV